MKKFFRLAIVLMALVVTLSFSSCQGCTRQWGGTTTIELEPGEKLVEVTWKDNNVWYLVEPMEPSYMPKTKVFKEQSNAGVFEGQVIFIEKRK